MRIRRRPDTVDDRNDQTIGLILSGKIRMLLLHAERSQ
jgi:hypothetical protein